MSSAKYEPAQKDKTVVAEPLAKPQPTSVREGDMVQYRTATGGFDGILRRHDLPFAEGGDPPEIWRPALVVRVWQDTDPPILNLQVLADGQPTDNCLRTSVPHESDVDPWQTCWKRRE